MAELILVQDVVFIRYPDGYDVGESNGEIHATDPDAQAYALEMFGATKEDVELVLTTNDGGTVYLLRKDGFLFARSQNLDES